jgi:hypothetical protein
LIHWKGRRYEDPGLPPRDVWLLDPERERIATPTDERGLVVVPSLIAAVRKTIRPEYRWTAPYDIHHFQWPDAWYPYYPGIDRANPHQFRELSIHKGLVPREFHNWLHRITIPPPVPSHEVMFYRVEAWDVARALFGEVQGVFQWERRMRRRVTRLQHDSGVLPPEFSGVDLIGQTVMADVLSSNFRGIERHLARLDGIPEEHRLFEPTDSPLQLASALGRLVVPTAMPFTQSFAA